MLRNNYMTILEYIWIGGNGEIRSKTRVSNIDKEILKINSEILNIKNTFKNVTTPSNKSGSNYPDKDNNYSGFSNEDYMNYG